MRRYDFSHLSDPALLNYLAEVITRGRRTTAEEIAVLAEVEARRLYVAEGHPSLFSYCVHVLYLSDDAAYKRIQAARASRKFPTIFERVADGRLHLTAVVKLAPHLTPENAVGLLDAATHKTKADIELLLAQRFPQPDLPTMIKPIAPLVALAPDASVVMSEQNQTIQLVPEPVAPSVLVKTEESRARIAPLAPERFGLQTTIDQETRDLLKRAQELLGHQVRAGDVAEVLKRALSVLVGDLEKRKCAATDRPRAIQPCMGSNLRHIPADVKRVVVARDGGRCTFVSESGQRCPCRTDLEYDHIEPVARGGRSTIGNVRMRCRAHNQYEAEKTYGYEFMRHKREAKRSGANG